MSEQTKASYTLLLTLLRGYYWLDEGVRSYGQSRGTPKITRSQGMVMANIILGYHRPSDIARQLGISRQAIHTTIRQMVKKNIVALETDPDNSRIKLVNLTTMGEIMRSDGYAAMGILIEILEKRIGKKQVAQITAALAADWGEPPSFPPATKVAAKRRKSTRARNTASTAVRAGTARAKKAPAQR